MFGIASFAQTPFASLAGRVFVDSVTENITLADASNQTYAFLQSITENSNPESVESITAQFAQSVTENADLADTQNVFFAFGQTRTEDIWRWLTPALSSRRLCNPSQNLSPPTTPL